MSTRGVSEDGPPVENCCSPKTTLFKSVGFLLMCFVGFGGYFCFDNPGALQDKFQTDMNMPVNNYVILYSVILWPNVILCFVGGFLLDRVFGVRWGTIFYATLTVCGQLLFAMGAYENIFWLMVLGRFVFGSGQGSLDVAQSSYAVLWFKSKALSTLLGLHLSIARLGSTANSLTLENIHRFISENFNYSGAECVGIVLFIASTMSIASLICAIMLGYMDSRAEKVLERNDDERPELVKLTDVKNFKMTFWMSVLLCAAYYVTLFPFMSLGKLYFMTKYELGPDAANTALSLVYSISAVSFPIFGILVDKTGRNILWVLISLLGSLFAHGLLAFTYVSPYICMVLLGFSYSSFASSFWSMIAFMVPEHQLGTAYGTTLAFQSLNLSVMSIVCGIIVDKYGYFMLELFFLAWLLISLVPAIVIWKSYTRSEVKGDKTSPYSDQITNG